MWILIVSILSVLLMFILRKMLKLPHSRPRCPVEYRLASRAVVVVGGDFARSPRMQYHAGSLLRCGLFQEVSLVGMHEGNKLCEELEGSTATTTLDVTGLISIRNVRILQVAQSVIKFLPNRKIQWVLSTLVRIGTLTLVFFWYLLRTQLFSIRRCDTKGAAIITVTMPRLILCQTPPAVPFVPLAKLAKWIGWAIDSMVLRASRNSTLSLASNSLIVDWHNFGFTLLEVDNRPQVVAQLYKYLELNVCQGDANVTVSAAMAKALTSRDGNPRVGPVRLTTEVKVLYDTAPSFFRPASRAELKEMLSDSRRVDFGENTALSSVPSWIITPDGVTPEKSLIIVSSTSWGSDDDYEMVVRALQAMDRELNAAIDTNHSYVVERIWVVVTGKGVTRERFEAAVAAANLTSRIAVSTAYFQSFKDYSTMLGAADVGLSVHFSSSGLDLPMKCVDMLGAGLPVMAVSYPTIGELVDDRRGWIFSDAEELTKVIRSLCTKEGRLTLCAKRQYVVDHRNMWDDEWGRSMRPLVASLCK